MITNAFHFWFLCLNIVSGTALDADTAAGQTAHNQVFRHNDIDDLVDLDHFIQRLGLGNGARKAVQDKSAAAVAFGKAFADNPNNDLIGDEFARLGIDFCLQAHFRTAFQRFTNNIAG